MRLIKEKPVILRALSIIILILMAAHGHVNAAEKQIIRVGIRPYAPPIIYFELSNGGIRYKGAQAEVLRLLERNLDVKFEYISSDDVSQRRRWLKEGRIDMVPDTGKEIDNDPKIRFISTGVKLEYRIYAQKNCETEDCYYDFSNKRIVLISGVRYPKFLDKIRQHQKIMVNTDEEALKMLNNELVDLFVTPSQKVSDYLIVRDRFKNIHPVGEVLGKIEMGYAIRAEDEDLYRRLSVAIKDLVDSGTIVYLENKSYQEAFEEIRRKKNTDRFLFILSFFILVIVVGGIWSYLLKNQVRRITRELKTSEEKLNNLIRFSPDMIFVVAQDGKIMQWNQRAELELGTLLDGSVERWLTRFVIKEERESFSAFLEQALNGMKCMNEFHFINEKGTILDMEVVSVRLPAADPDRPTICCYARDMTKRNLLEQELIQADRLATIGQMAAAVAHEINNPLGIVQANVGLLMSQGISDVERLEAVNAISRNVDRAGKITHDLLDIAKPKPAEMKVVDLEDLMTHTLGAVKLQLKGIDVRHDPGNEDSYIKGDPGLLEQVFINLILNARTAMQASPEKHLTIQHEGRRDDGRVKIAISDTGKGISPEQIKKIFDPFYTTNARSGFGLGLFLSHRIIENHGGTLEVYSTEGVGTDFVIYLPAIKEKENAS